MTIRRAPPLHPSSEKIYPIDWKRVLADGESIASVVWTVPAELGDYGVYEDGTITAIGLRDSGATVNTDYQVDCEIATSNSQKFNVSLLIKVSTDGY